jgi:hypothetical protein
MLVSKILEEFLVNGYQEPSAFRRQRRIDTHVFEHDSVISIWEGFQNSSLKQTIGYLKALENGVIQ